jgi:hypothetical protein
MIPAPKDGVCLGEGGFPIGFGVPVRYVGVERDVTKLPRPVVDDPCDPFPLPLTGRGEGDWPAVALGVAALQVVELAPAGRFLVLAVTFREGWGHRLGGAAAVEFGEKLGRIAVE